MVEQTTFNREVPGSSPGGPTTPPSPNHEEARPAGVRSPPRLLWAAGVGAVAVALVLIAGLAVARWPFGFDRAVTIALHGAGPAWLRSAMIDVTALGGTTVLTIVVVAAAALLLARRLWLTAALVVVASVTGSIAVQLLKAEFGRARPAIVDPIVEVTGNSFPSGHAANSAIVYLTVAGLVTQVSRGRATRNTIVALTILLVGAIGASRVYLGVHWASDVLAGWSFGTLWALGWWLAGAKARERLLRPRE